MMWRPRPLAITSSPSFAASSASAARWNGSNAAPPPSAAPCIARPKSSAISPPRRPRRGRADAPDGASSRAAAAAAEPAATAARFRAARGTPLTVATAAPPLPPGPHQPSPAFAWQASGKYAHTLDLDKPIKDIIRGLEPMMGVGSRKIHAVVRPPARRPASFRIFHTSTRLHAHSSRSRTRRATSRRRCTTCKSCKARVAPRPRPAPAPSSPRPDAVAVAARAAHSAAHHGTPPPTPGGQDRVPSRARVFPRRRGAQGGRQLGLGEGRLQGGHLRGRHVGAG